MKYLKLVQAIGARLEEFLVQDRHNFDRVKAMVEDENKHRDLLVEDEEEDFLDECKFFNNVPVLK